jgi:hypothetical protein
MPTMWISDPAAYSEDRQLLTIEAMDEVEITEADGGESVSSESEFEGFSD